MGYIPVDFIDSFVISFMLGHVSFMSSLGHQS